MAEDDFDLDMVMDELGSFGRFQLEIVVYLLFPVMLKAMYNTQYVFSAGQTNYRCRVPQCESTPEQFEPGPWASFALTKKSDCYRKVAIGTTCEPSSFSKKIERCNSWVYENHYSIVHEFNLACKEWKRTLVGTIHSFAYFTALPAIAYFSDAWGRGRVLIFTAIVPAFFGVGRAFVNNYYVYLLVEYFESFTGSGTYSTAFILSLEMVSVSNRVIAGNVIAALFALGQSCSGLTAYFIRYWRTFNLAIYTPSFAFVIYICLYKESLRWLAAHGKRKEAAKIINRAAKMNNKQLSLKTQAMLTAAIEKEEAEEVSAKARDDRQKANSQKNITTPDEPPKKAIWKKVMKSKTILFRLFICSYMWVTMNLVSYGLSINSVSLSGNRYANFSISALVEMPGSILSALTLNRFGRKGAICVTHLLCGTSLLTSGIIGNPILVNCLTMCGKLFISMIHSSLYIYTCELFPTEARHSLLGVCSMMGRIGAMLAPQTPLLLQSGKNVPNIIFGIMTCIGGLCMTLTPETLKMKLPDTIEQAENLQMMPRTTDKTDVLTGNQEKQK